MLNHVKEQTLPSFLKEHWQQTFSFLGLWQALWKQREDSFGERGHFIEQSPYIRSWHSGKGRCGSNLFLLRNTIQVHQRNKSLRTVTLCLINMLSYFTLNKTIKVKRTLPFFLTEILLIIKVHLNLTGVWYVAFVGQSTQHWQKEWAQWYPRSANQFQAMTCEYENWLGTRVSILAKPPPTKYSIPLSFNADKRQSLIALQWTSSVSNQELF